MDYLLEVENNTIKFFTKEGTVHKKDKVSFKLKKGEILE
jgi:ABC-type dipeptide/oligopeptide/nickel transport system, ATPase component